MILEITAIVRALQISKGEGLIIINNMVSIIFTSLAKQYVANSRKLQDYLSENPKLEDYALQIEALMNSIKFIFINW